MESKSTNELIHEIKNATDVEDYLTENKQYLLTRDLSEYLNMLLRKKEIRKADVARNSLLDRVYVYQIFSGIKVPSRNKLIAMSFGLHLSDEEANTMLKLSGNRELYARDERDAIILFALQREMNISDTNELLFNHGLEVLGSMKE